MGDAEHPTIRCVVGSPHLWIESAIRSLRADPDMYTRDKEIVHVTRVTDEEHEESAWTDTKGRVQYALPIGSPQIHTMGKATLRVRMARWASWERPKMIKGQWEDIPCEPSKEQAEEVLGEKHWAGLRRLVGVSETPFPRPDLSIVQGERHHDKATGYLFEPSTRFPRVDDAPTQERCRKSREALEDLLSDFPFANGSAGVSGAVALLFTMVTRPAILGPVPAWVIGATTPGTGKTLLVDVCSAVAYGRDAGRTPFPDATGRNSDEEMKKVLGMLARMGAPLVNFDNVDEGTIGGDSLETVISVREDYTFRILGLSEGLTMPVRMVFAFTANNPQWSRGMNRRILHVSLESPFADPEHRPLDSYAHPERAGQLYEYAVEHRAEYVHHVLTILRGYAAAGCPNPLTLGTFEAWAALVPSALVWAGGADPMLCRPGADGEESPDAMQRATLAIEWAAWCHASSLEGVTAHNVVERLYPERERGQPLDPAWDAFRGAVEYFAPPHHAGVAPDPAKLGEALRRRLKGAPIRTADAPAPLRRFVAVGKSGGRTRWAVENVNAYKVKSGVGAKHEAEGVAP